SLTLRPLSRAPTGSKRQARGPKTPTSSLIRQKIQHQQPPGEISGLEPAVQDLRLCGNRAVSAKRPQHPPGPGKRARDRRDVAPDQVDHLDTANGSAMTPVAEASAIAGTGSLMARPSPW
ncbi:MAG TPA: hypothetical protein VGM07_03830, partial [Stellaceae bacterium]